MVNFGHFAKLLRTKRPAMYCGQGNTSHNTTCDALRPRKYFAQHDLRVCQGNTSHNTTCDVLRPRKYFAQHDLRCTSAKEILREDLAFSEECSNDVIVSPETERAHVRTHTHRCAFVGAYVPCMYSYARCESYRRRFRSLLLYSYRELVALDRPRTNNSCYLYVKYVTAVVYTSHK